MDRDLWTEIIQVIGRNPGRTLLSGFGVAWGVFMIIITMGAAKGLENGVKADMGNRATNSLVLWSQSTSKPYQGFQSGRFFQLTTEDVEYLQSVVPELEAVSPRNQLNGWQGTNNVIRGTKTGAFNVYGDTPDFINIQPLKLWTGRFINQSDMDDKRKTCVIGQRVYEVLFEDGEDPIGKFVQINGINFSVVGVYKSNRKGEDAEEETSSIYVPFTTFQRSFNYGNIIGWLTVLIDEDYNFNSISERMFSVLRARKNVHPQDQRAFGSWSMKEEFEEIDQVMIAMQAVGFVFGNLALLAGIIGICNIMLITIKERTKEFGIKRAIGATPGVVVKQVMMETIFLTLVFGVVGMIAGVGILETVNYAIKDMDTGSFRNPEIKLNTILFTMGVMVIMGAIAGLLPALRAVAIKPINALRAEG